MFHFVRNRRWLVSAILILVTISIIFWGIGAYLSATKKEQIVLRFARHEMSLPQVKELIHTQQMAYREVLGQAFDPASFLTTGTVFSVIDRFVDQQLINDQMYSGALSVSNNWLARFITSLPDYQENGHFSHEKYLSVLAKNGLTPPQFENDLRRKILAYQFSVGSLGTLLSSQKLREQMLTILSEQRYVNALRISSVAYRTKVSVSDHDARDFYDHHQADFMLSDRLSLQYVVLSLADYEAALKITAQEKRAYYAAHKNDFLLPEKRHLYSILFFVSSKATDVEREKIYQQALSVLEQLKRNPHLFATFARQYSADATAKEKAGDQSWVTRQDIEDTAWAEAIFSAQPRTFFLQKTALGYQLSSVRKIQKAHVASYEAVSAQLDQRIRQEKAAQFFPSLATKFSDMSDDNPRSLSLLANTFHLTIHTLSDLEKGVQPSEPLFHHEQLLSAVFSQSFTSGQLNSPVIEVQPNTYLVAHLVHFEPAHVQAFDQVRTAIMTRLSHEKSMALALGAAQQAYKHLSSGQSTGLVHVSWSPLTIVSRHTHSGFSPAAVSRIFSLSAHAALPVYSEPLPDGDGYVIFRLMKIVHPDLSKEDVHAQKLTTDLEQAEKNGEFMSLLSYWRHEAQVSVSYDAIAQSLQLKS